MDDVKEGAEPIDIVQYPGQGTGQIKAEPVDMHFDDPVSQAIHDELEHPGMPYVEGIAGTGIVHMVATIRLCKLVIGGIIDAPHGEGRSQLVSLRGMVVHDIKDDFDPSLMQPRHHHLELMNGVLLSMRGRVPAGRSKIAHGVIAPVVRKSPIEQITVVEEIVHGLQFDRGDPEISQVFDDRLRSKARVSASESLRQTQVQLCKSFDMQVIHDGLVPWCPRGLIIPPGKCRINHHRERRVCSAIPVVEREIAFRVAKPVAKDLVSPFHIASDALGIGIQ